MNKFEKVALQCAKDDIKREGSLINLKNRKRAYAAMFKEWKWSFAEALDFKNWNKDFK